MRHRQLSRRSAVIMSVVVAAAAPLATDAATATYPVGGFCHVSCRTHDFPVTTAGALSAEVTVTYTCSTAVVRFRVDDTLVFTSELLSIGESTDVVDLGPVTPGTHTLRVEADAGGGGLECDSPAWEGILSVTTSGVTDHDVAFVNPDHHDTVSVPGITATLDRSNVSPTAAVARLSVATYDGLPSGQPGDPFQPAIRSRRRRRTSTCSSRTALTKT
jgi:hypothetical protein